MKYFFAFSNFLEEISSLSHSVFLLYFFALSTEEGFVNNQCKEIEENNRMGKKNKQTKNRMGKTRDLFKKIRDTKGTFHAKMGTIKDRKDMDLTEAKDINKRCQ